jgi:omega-amidase
MLSEAAAAHDIVLVGGSIPERGVGVGGGGGADEEDVLYNACCVFDGKRGLIARHRKTHLFDVDIPGEISFRESDTLTEGEGLTVVDTAVGRVGVGPPYASTCGSERWQPRWRIEAPTVRLFTT